MPKRFAGLEFTVQKVFFLIEKFINWLCDKFGKERINLVGNHFPEVDKYAKDIGAAI